MNPARVWGVVVVLACVIGCSGGDDGGTTGTPPRPDPDPGGSTTNQIDVRDNSFSPRATTVAPGTTVTWTWRGVAVHDVTFDAGSSSSQQSTGTFAREFAAAGTYAYRCTIHSGMSGSVVVK